MTTPIAQRCYRHPNAETFVKCTRCGRPICPDCMVPASVGHQCPECVGEGRKLQRTVVVRSARPYGTYTIIAVCVVMFGLTGLDGDITRLYRYGAGFGPAVASGDWWRLVTPMFLHVNLFHIGLNMFALYLYGVGLEALLGTPRFLGLFLVSGFLGNALSFRIHPFEISVGASGAVFGILGAWVAYSYRRRANPRAEQMLRGLIGLIAINLVIGFTFRGIDIWAHIGGLIGGAIIGFAADSAAGRSRRVGLLLSLAGMAAVVAIGLVLVMTRVSTLPSCRLVVQNGAFSPQCG
jgi:membrane associated rhomboid family serine protease